MAEQALSASELDETVERTFPPAAHRILRAREALALTQDDVASRWGEQASMYWDLELYDDEVFTNISVRQFQRVAEGLGTSVDALAFRRRAAVELAERTLCRRGRSTPRPDGRRRHLSRATWRSYRLGNPAALHRSSHTRRIAKLAVCDRFVEPLASIG